MPRLLGIDRQCHRAETPAGVVDGVNGHVAPTAAGDAGEALLFRIGGGEEERQRHLPGSRGCGTAREIRQVAGWALQQAHESEGIPRVDEQPPFAGAVVGFQFLRGERERRARAHIQGEPPAPRAAVVNASHRDAIPPRPLIGYPQLAHLVGVAGGIEDRHQFRAVLTPLDRHVVHAGEEAVVGADVRQRLDVEVRVERQPPIAFADTHATGQPLAGIARLQIPGVEMRRLLGGERQRDGAEAPAGIVNGVDGYFARASATVDDAGKTLPRRMRSREEQRDGGLFPGERDVQRVRAVGGRRAAVGPQHIRSRRHLRADDEVGNRAPPITFGYEFAVFVEQCALHGGAALGFHPELARSKRRRNGNAVIVLVQRHLQFRARGRAERKIGGAAWEVGVVVGKRGERNVQRIRAERVAGETPHGDEVGSRGQLGADQEIRRGAAVVVRQPDRAIRGSERADHIRCASRLHANRAAFGNLETEIVGVGRSLQFAGGGRRRRHRGRIGGAVAVVVRRARRIEGDHQRVLETSCRPRLPPVRHPHEVDARLQRNAYQEIGTPAVVVILGNHLAVLGDHRTVRVGESRGFHAQPARLRQLHAKVVGVVAARQPGERGGRRHHRRGGFGRVAVVAAFRAQVGDAPVGEIQAGYRVRRPVHAILVAGLGNAQGHALGVGVATFRRGEPRHHEAAQKIGVVAAAVVGHDRQPAVGLRCVRLERPLVDIAEAERSG